MSECVTFEVEEAQETWNSCQEVISENEELLKEYASSSGSAAEMSGKNVREAFRDWQSGDIGSDELSAVEYAFGNGCNIPTDSILSRLNRNQKIALSAGGVGAGILLLTSGNEDDN